MERNIMLLSGLDKTKYFSDEVTREIVKCVNNPVNMVVIPAEPDNYSKNDKRFYGDFEVVGVFKMFRKIFPDLNILMLDDRVSVCDGMKWLRDADIVYLLGGNPFVQLRYLKESGYDDVIRNTSSMLIGCSAGSMNLGVNAYYSKDLEYPESVIYKGLGVVDITIDPHFDINNVEQVNEIKKWSRKVPIVGLPNNSFIVVSDGKVRYVGDVYLYSSLGLVKRK